MGKLVYCVFHARAARRTRRIPAGVDGGPIVVVCQGHLCAATSNIDAPALAPTVERILAFERVVNSLFATRTVVPMRFGSLVESDEKVERYLTTQAAFFEERLHALSGCVEFGLRLSARPEAHHAKTVGRRKDVSPGRAYLEKRAAQLDGKRKSLSSAYRKLLRYQRALRGLYGRMQILEPFTKTLPPAGGLGIRRNVTATEPETISAAFLVARQNAESFRKRIEEMSDPESHGLVGPWPPYSFAAR
jgi:hypothetical protein